MGTTMDKGILKALKETPKMFFRLQEGSHVVMARLHPNATHFEITACCKTGETLNGMFDSYHLDQIRVGFHLNLTWKTFFSLFHRAMVDRNVSIDRNNTMIVEICHIENATDPGVPTVNSDFKFPLNSITKSESGLEDFFQSALSFYTMRRKDGKHTEQKQLDAMKEKEAELKRDAEALVAEEAELRRRLSQSATSTTNCKPQIEAAQKKIIQLGHKPVTTLEAAIDTQAHVCSLDIPPGTDLKPDSELLQFIKGCFAAPPSTSPAPDPAEGEIETMHSIRHMSHVTALPGAVEKCKALPNSNYIKGVMAILLDEFDEYDFDVARLTERLAKQPEVEGIRRMGPLFVATYATLIKLGLLVKLHIDEKVLLNFLCLVEAGHKANPFHNATQTAATMQQLFFIAKGCGLMEKLSVSPLHLFGLVVAVAIGNFGHPGTQCARFDDIAVRYNGMAVLENHMLAQVFEYMKLDRFNIFMPFSQFDRLMLRRVVTEFWLHEDTLPNLLKDFAARGGPNSLLYTSIEEQHMVLALVAKTLRVSYCARPLEQYLGWTEKLLDEHERQIEAGNSSPDLFDRKDKTMLKRKQLVFLTFVVHPLYELLSSLLPKLCVTAAHLDKNKAHWVYLEE